MTTVRAPSRIGISAPDGPAALLLEKRLAHLHPSAVAHGGRWSVQIGDVDDRLEEIEAAITHWLRELGSTSTEVEVDGSPRTVRLPEAAAEAELAPDYETEPVLEHEP